MRRALHKLALGTLLGGALAVLPAGPLPLRAQGAAAAQAGAPDPASMIADRFVLAGDDTLTAEGGVEIFYQGTRLTASRVIYNGKTGMLSIEGPITLTDGSGTAMIADSAELSQDLSDGILSSARLILDDQIQIAARQVRRTDGRYTEMSRTVTSSCQVCPTNPTPLWEIRASRSIHDAQDKQIQFTHARLHVVGVPVFYSPYLRIPDPTVERMNGFLMPKYRSGSDTGLGIEVPYFITLGPSRDITLRPFVTTKNSQTMGLRYREAFRNGRFEADGALTRDDLTSDSTRGYVFAQGDFALPRDFSLGMTIQKVSDDDYLLDYDVSEQDRLESGVRVRRTRRNEHIAMRFSDYESLRPNDDNTVLPNKVINISRIRRFSPDYLGGEAALTLELHDHTRDSSVNFDANGDGITDGRDVSRLTAQTEWSRNWITGNGLVFTTGASVIGDYYEIREDAAYPSTVTRVTPTAVLGMRWPLARNDAGSGVAHVLEPTVQLMVSPNSRDRVPNEDSRAVTLDEGNLFSYDRFPGADVRELGKRVNVGLSYTRYDPAGWSLGTTVGRIYREKDLGQFSAGTGLDGATSDWLVASQIQTGFGLELINRALFDSNFDVSRNELVMGVRRPDYAFDIGYTWLVADPYEGRPINTSELIMSGHYQINDKLTATALGRYDFEGQRATRAGLGLRYRNECAAVDLSLSRRFTSSSTISPSTDISLSVALAGFGAGSDGRQYRRSCGS